MKVFLSYGDTRDQATALRLQSLAAVNGLRTFVPPAYTRTEPVETLDEASATQLQQTDVVLAVIQHGLSEACRSELNLGLQFGRPTIVMAESRWVHQLAAVQGLSIVEIDPRSPELAEQQIVSHLTAVKAEHEGRNALLALGTVALGLLIFAPQD